MVSIVSISAAAIFVTCTPMTNAFNFTVDSGDFRAAFDTAVSNADLPNFPADAATAKRTASAEASAWPATSKPPAACPPKTLISVSNQTARFR